MGRSKCCIGRSVSSNAPEAAGLYSALFRQYEDAWGKYYDLSKYEEALQKTLKGIQDGVKLASSSYFDRASVHPGKEGTDESSFLSFDFLSLATDRILDTNNDAAKEILACKEDIWSHKQLYDIVEEYFNLSQETLKFLHDLQTRLSDFKDRLGMLQSSFQKPSSAETKASALEGLRDCECFTPDFHSSLNKLISAHISMLERMEKWRNKSHKGIYIPRRRPKVSYTIFGTVFVSAVACSILADALHAPPLLAAIPAAAVSVTSWNPLISWVENMWKSPEVRNLQANMQIAESVHRKNFVVIHELRGIEISVKAMMEQKKSLVLNTDFYIETGDDVFILSCKESVMDRSGSLIKRIDKLNKQIDGSCRNVEDARSQILQRIGAGTEPEETCCISYCCHM